LQQAQQQLASCNASGLNNCASAAQQVASQQAVVDLLNLQLNNLLTQLSGVSSTTATGQSAPVTAKAAAATAVSSNTSWVQSIGNLFN